MKIILTVILFFCLSSNAFAEEKDKWGSIPQRRNWREEDIAAVICWTIVVVALTIGTLCGLPDQIGNALFPEAKVLGVLLQWSKY